MIILVQEAVNKLSKKDTFENKFSWFLKITPFKINDINQYMRYNIIKNRVSIIEFSYDSWSITDIKGIKIHQ